MLRFYIVAAACHADIGVCDLLAQHVRFIPNKSAHLAVPPVASVRFSFALRLLSKSVKGPAAATPLRARSSTAADAFHARRWFSPSPRVKAIDRWLIAATLFQLRRFFFGGSKRLTGGRRFSAAARFPTIRPDGSDQGLHHQKPSRRRATVPFCARARASGKWGYHRLPQ
jgi:hypothetical protein